MQDKNPHDDTPMKIEDGVSDMSIRVRIWRLAALACGTLVVLSLLVAWNLERIRETDASVQHNQMVLKALNAYSSEIVYAETGQRGFLLTGQEAYLAPYNQVLADNQSRFQQLQGLIESPENRRKIQRLAELFNDKLQELRETVQLARAGNLAGALAVVKQGRGLQDTVEFQRLSQEMADHQTASLINRQARAEQESRYILVGVGVGAIFAVLLIIGASERTVAQINAPLRGLMRGIETLAHGQMDYRINVLTHNEIGKVAEAFNNMADELLEATKRRERVEASLATSNKHLTAEIEERRAAQAELSRAMAELQRSNQELDNFAYSASHDLKAPLRGIRNLTAWIAEDVKDTAGEDTIENIALLHNRVERLDALLDSLLQYSQVGRTGGTPEDIDITRLIGEIAEYIAPRSGFTVACRGEPLIVHTNKAPLEQVFRNLIGNGLKHHDRDAGNVTVTARDLGDMVEFRVEDDGPGIPPAFHGRIFQMFQTLKSRDELEGSGMGLAIVKKSVDGQAGTIRVESAPPQRGTSFIFTWRKYPLAASA